jgi:hypothetical protein
MDLRSNPVYDSFYTPLYNNSYMSKGAPFAIETRSDIVKSAINNSTAKSMWSFSKKQRFPQDKSVCPYVSYQTDLSTISHRKTGFGTSKRRVFS